MRFSGVNGCPTRTRGASLVAQMLKTLPAMRESWGFLCRRKWQLAPVFLPGESQGQRTTVHGVKESDTTELLTLSQGRET